MSRRMAEGITTPASGLIGVNNLRTSKQFFEARIAAQG
jgi:hypothetical protein